MDIFCCNKNLCVLILLTQLTDTFSILSLLQACVCVCVCVCVCLRVNPSDNIRLGVKVDQGLPCVRDYIPRSSGKLL